MPMAEVIAEAMFELRSSDTKIAARIFKPETQDHGRNWSCTFEIDAPIAIRATGDGVSSLQALVHALQGLAAYLYGSKEYRQGELGVYGEFGGHLTIPAPSLFLGEAPYPF
jgi:hypothetical protein